MNVIKHHCKKKHVSLLRKDSEGFKSSNPYRNIKINTHTHTHIYHHVILCLRVMLNNLKYEFSYKSNSFKIAQNINSFYAIVLFLKKEEKNDMKDINRNSFHRI